MADVFIMVGGGIFGFFFKKYGFNPSALVLGPMVEKHFRNRGLSMVHDIGAFMSSPFVMVITLVIVVLCVSVTVKHFRELKAKKAEAAK